LRSQQLREQTQTEERHLVHYSSVLDVRSDMPRTPMAGITFTLYEEAAGGAPLWIETQNVPIDSQGHYTVLLGSTMPEGFPESLFTSGRARWLGIQVAGESEEKRIALASVPYALKAADAQTLGGRSAEQYALSEQIQTLIRHELQSTGLQRTQMEGIQSLAAADPKSVIPTEQDCAETLKNPRAVTMELLYCQMSRIIQRSFSAQLCLEPKFAFEGELADKLMLQGNVVAGVGAEAFGNGALITLLGVPEGRLDTGFSGGVELKVTGCWDFLQISPTKNKLASNPDIDALLAKLLETTNKLGLTFDPVQLQAMLDNVGNLTFDGGPTGILQAGQATKSLLTALPMPPAARAVISDPTILLTELKDLIDAGVCNLSNQVPPLAPLFQPICDLAQNEPFAKLLNRVDTVTANIQSLSNNINTVTGNINTVTGNTNTTVNTINSSVNTIRTTVNTINSKMNTVISTIDDIYDAVCSLTPTC
jgi:hypothetical protein